MNNWANTVNSETGIPWKIERLKALNLRNAYRLNLEREYNACTSARQPERLKMYAELVGNESLELGDKKPLG